MSFLRLTVVVAGLVLANSAHAVDIELSNLANDEQKKQAQLHAELNKQASHVSVAEVKVTGTDGKTGLQTICSDADGRVLALVAPPRGFAAPEKGATGEVHVYSAEGKPVLHWAVPFHANSINVGPDGNVYVAGEGKVAQYDKTGKAIGEPIELPHIASVVKDQAGLRKRAENQVKQQTERRAQAVKIRQQFEERVRAVESKPEAERTKTEMRQLEQARLLLETAMDDLGPAMTVEQIVRYTMSRMRVINGIAISEKDVFVACGEVEGYSYAVWRLNRDLTAPVKVLGELGGCCGQIDIQCSGAEILIAENTKHQFGRYDRDGKPLGAYGKKAGEAGPSGFGGCCNPMNLRAIAAGGDVLTAESEGVIKRFSPSGEFRGVVGTVPIKGECKNVALGLSPNGDHVYFCDQPSSRFFVLDRKPAAK